MQKGKEFNSRHFSLDPYLNYLPDEDRYLFPLTRPTYRFNLIGAGSNGQEHLRVTEVEGRATLHGIFDPNPRSVATAQDNYRRFHPDGDLVVYDSLAAACQDPAVDGLIISTPNYTHIDIVREAIKSGKHILLEKPMATTVPDAHAIMKLAQSYDAVFQVGLQYRYKAIYVESIYEALTRRSLGEIKTISIKEHRIPFVDKVGQWNKFARYSGGTLVEKCCHYFDLFNLFAQSRPIKVFATGSMAVNFERFEYNGQKSDIIDNAFVTIEYANGIRTSFNLCMFAPLFYEEIVICGDEGRLQAYERRDFLPEPTRKTYLEILRGERHPARICTPTYSQDVEESGHHGGTFFQHISFIDSIEGKESGAATAEEGFWSIVVGAAAEQAVATGEIVYVDELLASHDLT